MGGGLGYGEGLCSQEVLEKGGASWIGRGFLPMGEKGLPG